MQQGKHHACISAPLPWRCMHEQGRARDSSDFIGRSGAGLLLAGLMLSANMRVCWCLHQKGMAAPAVAHPRAAPLGASPVESEARKVAQSQLHAGLGRAKPVHQGYTLGGISGSARPSFTLRAGSAWRSASRGARCGRCTHAAWPCSARASRRCANPRP